MPFNVPDKTLAELLVLTDNVATVMSGEANAAIVRRNNPDGMAALRAALAKLTGDELVGLMALTIFGRLDLGGTRGSSLLEARQTLNEMTIDRLLGNAEALSNLWRRGLDRMAAEQSIETSAL